MLTYAGGDGKFYLVCAHSMWPGHGRVYRYVWDGMWSAPLDVAGNTAGWATPSYVGAATEQPLVTYVYRVEDVLWARTETGGVLSTPQNLDQLLADRGYTGASAFFVDARGRLHMVAAKTGAGGLYYLVA
jgi:hypothetical protein